MAKGYRFNFLIKYTDNNRLKLIQFTNKVKRYLKEFNPIIIKELEGVRFSFEIYDPSLDNVLPEFRNDLYVEKSKAIISFVDIQMQKLKLK